MNILGINAYHPNASAALVSDGRLVTAVEEERFNRVKYAAGFPAKAIHHCLAEAGLTLQDIDHVAVPRNPWARMGTKLYYALRMPRLAVDRAKFLARFPASTRSWRIVSTSIPRSFDPPTIGWSITSR